MDHLAAGNQYFVCELFGEAATSYSKAIGKLMGKDQFSALFGRGKCRIETNNINLAIADFSQCISLEPKDPLSNYYLGYCLMKRNSSDYKTLEKCKKYFENALNIKLDDNRIKNALNKVKKKLESLPAPISTTSTTSTTDSNADTNETKTNLDNGNVTNNGNTEEKECETNGNSNSPQDSGKVTNKQDSQNLQNSQNSQSKAKVKTLRDTWYQSPSTVTYTLYVKNLTKDDVNINFESNSITFELNLPNNEKYTRQILLFGTIIPEKCKFTVNKYKVNCTLQKLGVGEWKDLEKEGSSKKESDGFGAPIGKPWTTKKNWDEVDNFASAELEKDKPEGDEALQSLFQKIYGDADEDQRRAMVKSFQTSNGTVLSTNWKDVKDKDYEGKDKVLPTGQDVKKWEY